VHPGALLKSYEPTCYTGGARPQQRVPIQLVLVIACQRTKYSNTPWIDEKTGSLNHLWPKTVSWRVLVVCNDRLQEWILDDDDKNKTWSLA
jgi:hypothetical protein